MTHITSTKWYYGMNNSLYGYIPSIYAMSYSPSKGMFVTDCEYWIKSSSWYAEELNMGGTENWTNSRSFNNVFGQFSFPLAWIYTRRNTPKSFESSHLSHFEWPCRTVDSFSSLRIHIDYSSTSTAFERMKFSNLEYIKFGTFSTETLIASIFSSNGFHRNLIANEALYSGSFYCGNGADIIFVKGPLSYDNTLHYCAKLGSRLGEFLEYITLSLKTSTLGWTFWSSLNIRDDFKNWSILRMLRKISYFLMF